MISLKRILEGVKSQQTKTRIQRELRDYFEDDFLEIIKISENPTIYKIVGTSGELPGKVIKRRNRYIYQEENE